jgi:hypothetical protein
MENLNVKGIVIAIVMIIFFALFGYILQAVTTVIANFAEVLSDIIRHGLSGGHGIEPVVRFCVSILLIYILVVVLVKIFKA